MKALWLCNVPISKISSYMSSEGKHPFGGWLEGASDAFLSDNNNSLIILFPWRSDVPICGSIDNLRFYSFNYANNSKTKIEKLTNSFKEIISKEEPDIIHIWGTEYPYSYYLMQSVKSFGLEKRVVIWIQGLVSICALHYVEGLNWKILHLRSLRDIIKNDSLIQQQKRLAERGRFEERLISDAYYVIGRTDWDRACSYQINKNVKYFSCNETLRSDFYNQRWDLEKVRRNTIFVSQGNVPHKGLHYALRIVSILKVKYANIKLICAGFNRNQNSKFYYSSYELYINYLIEKYGLQDNIYFTGLLDEQEMIKAYLSCHVFLSSSSIENSSNSVCEAMLLGMPVVASYVGGIPSLITNNEEGLLYPLDEPYMAAYQIDNIFSDDTIAKRLGENARKKAVIAHDRNRNYINLIEIYNSILTE